MPDPLKLQVLKRLTTHLEGIEWQDPESDETTLQGRVFRGRTRFGENEPGTFLSLLEAPRPDSGREGGENNASRHYEWSLLLQGWTYDDPKNPSDPAYFLQEAVRLRLEMIVAERSGGMGGGLYPDIYRLDGLITNLAISPGVVRPPTDGVSSKAFLYMPLLVGLATTV